MLTRVVPRSHYLQGSRHRVLPRRAEVMARQETILPEVTEVKGSSFAYGAVYALKDKDGSIRFVPVSENRATIAGTEKVVVDLSPDELIGYADYDVKRDGHDSGHRYIRDENRNLIPVSYPDKCALFMFFNRKTKKVVTGFDPLKEKPEQNSPQKKIDRGVQLRL